MRSSPRVCTSFKICRILVYTRRIYLIPEKNHVERDVFVASAARLDNVDALPGQLHLFLRHTRGVETDERLDQPSLGRRVYVHFPSCWHWTRFRFRHAEFIRLASEVLAQTGFIERPARAGELVSST